MHKMINHDYPLADGFIYVDKSIFWLNIYPQETTIAYRMYNPRGQDYVSFGLAYKHESDQFSKKMGRKVSYTRIYNELQLMNNDFDSQYEASKREGDDKWRYRNRLWHHKRLESFTVALDEMLAVIEKDYEVPRHFTPEHFKSLNASQIKTNYTDQFFYDIVDTYIYDLFKKKGAYGKIEPIQPLV